MAITPSTSERAKVPRGPRELKTGLRNGTLWTFPCGVPWKEVKPPRETLGMAPDNLLSAGQRKQVTHLWTEGKGTGPSL